jgi:hypothetical protein
MYEIAFGPLCNSTECTLGLDGRLLLFKELVAALPYKYPLPLFVFHASLPPPPPPPGYQLTVLLVFMSVLYVSVLPEEELLKFHFKEVMFDYLAL